MIIPSSLVCIIRNARFTSANLNRCVVMESGSTRPLRMSPRSRPIRSDPPGQSAVRIVLSLIPTPQSRRGIGTVSPSPWYPTLEIVPPGRVALTHAANVVGEPSASMALSTPRPPVSRRIASTGSSFV